ncbi:MAG: hypothetical protein HKN11_00210 [Rhizobiales bacterium]|nr:hypothetical protein [Hyphomicrobiales bacterium]
MRHIALGCMAVLGFVAIGQTPTPADARGGVNSSYARAYCLYYLNMASTAARGNATRGLASAHGADDRDRQSPAYWRRVYRECLKENGY